MCRTRLVDKISSPVVSLISMGTLLMMVLQEAIISKRVGVGIGIGIGVGVGEMGMGMEVQMGVQLGV